jgi:Helix-loop-helix DNA-binding domain
MAPASQAPSVDAPPAEIKSGDALNNLMKSMRTGKGNSESGSSNGGDHSDNSALVSIGNTSFGFNFDSEEGCSNNSKEGQNDSNEDSDGNAQNDKAPVVNSSSTSSNKKRSPQQDQAASKGSSGAGDEMKSTTSSLSSSTNSNPYNNAEQRQAAAHAVASLASIARAYPKLSDNSNAASMREALDRKRKKDDDKDADSGGYNTDDEEQKAPERVSGSESNSKGGAKSRKKKREENEHKREERNQREKERSFRISKQITDLRNLLSSGGVVVPKGTKSSVLTEAANYIRLLQQHQYRSEM